MCGVGGGGGGGGGVGCRCVSKGTPSHANFNMHKMENTVSDSSCGKEKPR